MDGGDQQSLQKGTVRPPHFQIIEIPKFKIQRRLILLLKTNQQLPGSLSLNSIWKSTQVPLIKQMLTKHRIT